MPRKIFPSYVILVVILAAALGITGGAYAQPPAAPHQFYGTVTINDSPAPAGTTIAAQINGITYASTTVDSQGKYGYSPLFQVPPDNPGTPGKDGGVNGDVVQFFVGGTAAQTYVYASGGITKLHLSVGSSGGGTPPAAPVPSSPANNATNVSTSPTLQWNASAGATSYQVQVSTSSDFTATVFNQSGITGTQVTVSPALDNNTTYYWRVNASNTSGTSDWSATRSFTTEAGSGTPPAAPVPSSPANNATNVSTSPTLQWNASAGATSYQVQVSTSSDFTATVFNQSGITGTQVTVSPALDNNTTYYWRVNASNTSGTSDWSATRSFTTEVTTTPPPPGSVTISASLMGHSRSFEISSSGVLDTAVTLSSPDGSVQLVLNANTTVNIPGESLTVTEASSPPAAPQNARLIAAYELAPSNSTFEPAITLTIKYDPASLPPQVDESSLFIAFWTGSVWNSLPSTVDTSNNTVSAAVSHFTVFALLGNVSQGEPPPAAVFTVSDLKVSPALVKPGQTVTITATVSNNGDIKGSYQVVLSINGANEAEKELVLEPNQAKEVKFVVSKQAVGDYTVVIGDQRSSFRVSEATASSPGRTLPTMGAVILAIGGLLIIVLAIIVARRLSAA